MKNYYSLVGVIAGLWQVNVAAGFASRRATVQPSRMRIDHNNIRSTTPLRVAEFEKADMGVSISPTVVPASTNGTLVVDTTSTISSEAAISVPDSQLQRGRGVLELWKRRLITLEDPFSLHKLASIGYTVSTTVLLGSAAIRFATSPELFAEIPLALEPVLYAFTISNTVMCVASVRMAFLHRQGDVKARNAFLGTAVSSLFSGYFMVWISPFAPGDLFNNIWVSRACFALLVGLNGIFIVDTVLNTEEILEGRRDRKAEDYQARIFMDTMGYVFPVAFGLPLIAATGYIASILHDREWFLQQCQFIDQMTGYPGMQAHIFYQQLSTSLGASYASLFVTLRDKKLINKTQELIGIAIFAVPAFVWSMYTTIIFTPYLFVEH